jgi:AsmA protein
MVSLSGMTVALKLMPLLSSRIVVEKFILLAPLINLEIDEGGRPNWHFAGMAGRAGTVAGTTEAAQVQAEFQTTGGSGIEGLSLGEIRLENGTVHYSDWRSGEEVVIGKINMDLDMPSLEAPMVASGRANWTGEEVSLTLRVESPANAIAGATTPLSVSVDSSPVKLAFDGSVTNGQTAAAAGIVDLDVPSLRALAAWAGSPLAFEGDGFGPLSIKGTLALDGQKVSFTDADIGFDEISGKGEVAFDGGGLDPVSAVKSAIKGLIGGGDSSRPSSGDQSSNTPNPFDAIKTLFD